MDMLSKFPAYIQWLATEGEKVFKRGYKVVRKETRKYIALLWWNLVRIRFQIRNWHEDIRESQLLYRVKGVMKTIVDHVSDYLASMKR